MSGDGAKKRQHALAKRAAKLSRQGVPHKEIAELVGIKQEQVKARVALGERLLSLEEG